MKWILTNIFVTQLFVSALLLYIFGDEEVNFPHFYAESGALLAAFLSLIVVLILGIQYRLSDPEVKWSRTGWAKPFSFKPSLLQFFFLLGWTTVLLGMFVSAITWYVFSEYQALNSLVIMLSGSAIMFGVEISQKLYKKKLEEPVVKKVGNV